MAFDNIPVYVPLVEAGKLRVLAVTTERRATILPNVPTSAEAGMPGLISVGLFSLFAPLNTPAETIALLSRESIVVLRDPKVREALVKQGMEPAGSTPQELRTQVENEVNKWAKVIKEADIPKE
jgi:tripartite-type tricarboxylate transporter receptor subunit TctC